MALFCYRQLTCSKVTPSKDMELFRIHKQENDPDIYTFVFMPPNEHGDYPMYRIPDSPQWPYSPFLHGEFDPNGENEHLGVAIWTREMAIERRLTLVKALGAVMFDRFITRIAY